MLHDIAISQGQRKFTDSELRRIKERGEDSLNFYLDTTYMQNGETIFTYENRVPGKGWVKHQFVETNGKDIRSGEQLVYNSQGYLTDIIYYENGKKLNRWTYFMYYSN